MFDVDSARCYCANDSVFYPPENACLPRADRRITLPCDTCHGNPLVVGNGTKLQIQELGWQPWLPLHLTFNSIDALPFEDGAAPYVGNATPLLPGFWSLSLEREFFYSGPSGALVNFVRPDGNLLTYGASASGSSADLRIPASPVVNDQAWGAGWTYFRDASAMVLEEFDRDLRRVTTLHHATGKRLTFSRAQSATADYPLYAPLYVEDQDGRRWSLGYRAGFVVSVTDPAGKVVSIDSTASGVTGIRWPDGTSRRFLYEDGNARLLSGYVNEAGVRAGTYRYDATGRAISTERALGLDAFSVRWTKGPRNKWVSETYDPEHRVIWRDLYIDAPKDGLVTFPNGSTEALEMDGTFGLLKWSAKTQTGVDGLSRTTRRAFDARMNVTQLDDYNGVRSCMTYAADRNVELTRIEGLNATAVCDVVRTAALPAGARKISTQWHPLWRMATRTAEPLRVTTIIHNGQPDPFNGNAIASCAPSDGVLSNREPIAVVCKRVEQATTDETGEQGFDAQPKPGVATRMATWTYTSQGKVLTERDARGVTIVTNEYYAATTADYTKNDLKSTTNAVGHKTSFLRYNAYGQPLEVVDANAASTVYTYDARQRVKTTTTSGSTTTFDYWPTGELKRTSQADGSTVNYEYDDARRLTAVADSRGNRVEYTLDAEGKRIKENAKDPSGALKRTMSRAFDALGRAQQTTGRE
ncbi:hypothetical protein ABE85_18055 [Mitsuaria sp. 7]|nr:hypothetical protein ABE85_18055 [Mitsuaria sp. 7]